MGISQEECEANGCCWSPAEFEGAPHVDLPWCFKLNDGASTYKVDSFSTQASQKGFATDIDLQAATQPELGLDVGKLRATATEIAPGIVRVRITDAHASRWEVPASLFKSDLLARTEDSAPLQDAASGNTTLAIELNNDPFSFTVLDTINGRALWNSSGTRLVFKDQYLEISTWVEESVTLFGAGERASDSLHLVRNGMPRALWNHDLGPTFLEQNSYGSHPFVMALAPGMF